MAKKLVFKTGAKKKPPVSKQMLADAAKSRGKVAKTAKPVATHEGYCMKCRTKVTVPTEGRKVHANKMASIHGSCPTCGTSVHRMVGKA